MQGEFLACFLSDPSGTAVSSLPCYFHIRKYKRQRACNSGFPCSGGFLTIHWVAETKKKMSQAPSCDQQNIKVHSLLMCFLECGVILTCAVAILPSSDSSVMLNEWWCVQPSPKLIQSLWFGLTNEENEV